MTRATATAPSPTHRLAGSGTSRPNAGDAPRVVAAALALFPLAFLLLFAGGGCASAPAPAPPPAAQDAQRFAEQAARLQAAGQWPSAAQWWERAARQFQLLNQSAPLATAWHNQALCLAESGKTEEANSLLQRALDLNLASNRPEEAWRQEIALLQWADRDHCAARLKALETRWATGTRPTEPHLSAVLDYEWARAHWRLGDSAQAAQRLPGLEARFQAAGDATAAATAVVLQARVFDSLRRREEAVALWRNALSRFERLAQPRGIAIALAGLGRTLAEDETTREESRSLLERAEANHRALGLPWPGDSVP